MSGGRDRTGTGPATKTGDGAPAGTPDAGRPARLDPNDSLGYLLRDTHRYFSRLLQARIERHGISMGQWFFLRVLWQEDGLTQAELGHRAGIMSPTTVAAINTMERKGLIERRRHPTDRRKHNVYLTKAGRQLERRLMPYAIEVNALATDGLPAAEVDQARDVLRRVRANLIRRLDAES